MTADCDAVRNKLREMFGGVVGGKHGYSVPDITHFLCHKIGENWLVTAPDKSVTDVAKLRTNNGSGNIACFCSNASRDVIISFLGSDSIAFFGGNSTYRGRISAYMRGDNQKLFVGDRCEINSANFLVVGNDSQITIGDECLLSFDVNIRTHDEHGIIDMTTGHCLNPAADVHIEPHVWLAREVSIHGGVHIGFGSIIGERAMVKKSIPRLCMAVGTPARVIRTNVSWSNSLSPEPDLTSYLMDFEKKLGPADLSNYKQENGPSRQSL